MSERKYYERFKKKILKADPNCWPYKIPDTLHLGGKKPGDFFLVIKGVPFLLEFKSTGKTLTRYQLYQATEFILAGGEALRFREGDETIDEFINRIFEIVKKRKEVKT